MGAERPVRPLPPGPSGTGEEPRPDSADSLHHHLICGGAMAGVNISVFVKVHSSKEAMTEQQRKNSWSLLACAAIIALIVLVFIQQSSVKHRAIEAAHERATEQ
jgi:hypothetical protein